MIPQIPTFFRSMSLVLMLLAIEAWVSSCRVTGHLVWPFKEWIVFYLLENSVHRFSKYNTNHLGVDRFCWSDIIFPRSNSIKSVRPEIPLVLRDNLHFTFSLLLIFFNSLVFIIRSISRHILVKGLPVKDFLSSCSLGRSTLKVLMATPLKSPSISLYIFQYLSEYVFRVSPSCMDMDSNESKGLGTLLHVTKQELKA